MDHVYQDISFASLFHGQKSEKLSDEAKMGLKETTPTAPRPPHTRTFSVLTFIITRRGIIIL